MPTLFLPRICLPALFIVSHIAACTPPDKPPSQQQVEQAWKRTDEAIQQSHEAEQKRDEAQRLREVDRVRAGAEQAELVQQRQVLAGWAVGVTLLGSALLLWLGLELRRRRVFQAALHALLESKGVDPRESIQPSSSPESLA